MRLTTQEQFMKMMDIQIFADRIGIQEERWITSGKENVCPMCSELEALDWLPYGTLPRFRRAHSELGDGNWKAPDSSCGCHKGYRKKSVNPNRSSAVLEWNGTDWIAVYTGDQFRVMMSKEDAKAKVQAILNKYKSHDCGDHK
jgi:hypothetical protein